ncbi:hypothetical protein [Cacao swollen shoot Togo A virus]|uniref:Uncharacterized protein n=1 Tax=Cacao swollen shoot Togo A virus TaxID=1960254 RepID=Q5TJ68_9VIRU|nr:hypothetical protein QKK15_gp4 [Cacao swollen shoot Togo A virus]CAG70343.1 hypothetical protein [Cacao swollen shoot Togo A virus]
MMKMTILLDGILARKRMKMTKKNLFGRMRPIVKKEMRSQYGIKKKMKRKRKPLLGKKAKKMNMTLIFTWPTFKGKKMTGRK